MDMDMPGMDMDMPGMDMGGMGDSGGFCQGEGSVMNNGFVFMPQVRRERRRMHLQFVETM